MARRIPTPGAGLPSRPPNPASEVSRLRLSMRSSRAAGGAHGCHGVVAGPELGGGSGKEPLAERGIPSVRYSDASIAVAFGSSIAELSKQRFPVAPATPEGGRCTRREACTPFPRADPAMLLLEPSQDAHP